MNRATPGKVYGAKVTADVEQRYAVLYGVNRPVPTLRKHPLGLACVSFKVRGVRRWVYFGPFGSQTARARYAKFRREWPAQLHDEHAPGRWPRPRWLTFNGRTMRLCDWAKEAGLKPTTLSNRLDVMGWSVEKALTTP